MKNIVYIMISTIIVLSIVQIVISLFKGDYKLIQQVSGVNDETKNVSSDNMLHHGEVYDGTDILELIRYNEQTNVIIEVKFQGSNKAKIDNVNRDDDIVNAINKIKTGFYNNGTDNISFVEAEYDVISMTNTNCEFKLKT